MTARLLPTVPALRTTGRLLRPWEGASQARGFGGARRTLLRDGSAARAPIRRVTVTNSIRLASQVCVRVTLLTTGSGPAPPPGGGARAGALRDFAQQAIDAALREAIDQELAVMERGENVAANQRRMALMTGWLRQKPTRTVERFYAARMLAMPPGAPVRTAGARDFSSDIAVERPVRVERRVVERHSEKIVERTPAASPGVSADSAGRVADIVVERLERKMRNDRERRGVW